MYNDIDKEINCCTRCKDRYEITTDKPDTFYGSEKPKIMIIGHSPAVRAKEQADVVLKMNMPKRALY